MIQSPTREEYAAVTVIDLLKLQARLASAEYLINQANEHLSIRPDDREMIEARHLLSDAALTLRRQLRASTQDVIRI
jgi:hypothetical protein